MTAAKTSTLFALCLSTLILSACLSDLGTNDRFVDEPDPFFPVEDDGSTNAPSGSACASTRNCASGLRCLRSGETQFCVETCREDDECTGNDQCNPVVSLIANEEGWCGEAPEDAPSPEEPDEPDEPNDAPGSAEDDYPDLDESDEEPTPSDPVDDVPAPSGACGSALEARQWALVNADRRQEGLPALCCHAGLGDVARDHSADMAFRDFFDHTNPDGQTPWDRMDEAGVTGWSGAGENIAYGYPTPEAVQEGWMNSPGHRANILSDGFSHVGVGLYNDNGTLYWTQVFAYFPDLPCD